MGTRGWGGKGKKRDGGGQGKGKKRGKGGQGKFKKGKRGEYLLNKWQSKNMAEIKSIDQLEKCNPKIIFHGK